MSDLISRLKDLHIQATKERSHYYVGSLVTESIATIEKLEARIADWKTIAQELAEALDQITQTPCTRTLTHGEEALAKYEEMKSE